MSRRYVAFLSPSFLNFTSHSTVRLLIAIYLTGCGIFLLFSALTSLFGALLVTPFVQARLSPILTPETPNTALYFREKQSLFAKIKSSKISKFSPSLSLFSSHDSVKWQQQQQHSSRPSLLRAACRSQPSQPLLPPA